MKSLIDTNTHKYRGKVVYPIKIQRELLNEVINDYESHKADALMFTCFTPCTRSSVPESDEKLGNLTTTANSSISKEANNFSDYVNTTQIPYSPTPERRRPKRSQGNCQLNFGDL